MNESLIFNILTFDFPKENLTFYFSKEEIGHSQRLHWSLFPNDIDTIFPNIHNDGTEFIYTTFKGEVEGYTPLSINLSTENKALAKRYYDRQINYYFRKVLNQIVKVGFIKENQVWLPLPNLSNNDFDFYDKYSVKVQIAQISNTPEIYISHDAVARVLKRNVAELSQTVSTTFFKTIMFRNKLHKYADVINFEDYNPHHAYPVLNIHLARVLGYEFSLQKNTRVKPNHYTSFLSNVQTFINTYFKTKEFAAMFPLHSTNLLKVNPSKVATTNPVGNQLLFGQKHYNTNQYLGMLKGPYQRPKYTNIHFFFVFHKDSFELVKTLHTYFEKGIGIMPGFLKYTNVAFHTEKKFSVVFVDKNNPIPEIQGILDQRTFNQDVKYFAIYVTPHSKDKTTEQTNEIYYKVKETFLNIDIPTQVIDPVKMSEQGENFRYSLPNIFIAIIAKLKGIPWRLPKQKEDELIVGVGAFKHIDIGVQFLGSAFSFNNNGTFNRFEYFRKDQVDILAGSIGFQIRQYTAANNKLNKLVIHFYKTMSDDELEPILKELKNLEQDIPVFIITINKTLSKELLAFDNSLVGLMPKSGTYISLGDNKFLLFNNTRYSNEPIKKTEAWHFPIKLKIECTQPELLNEEIVVSNLIQQVYEFSKIYWKSVSHQNLPVTIKYPEMVAQMAPYFQDGLIPHFGKDNLWFL